MVPNSNGTPEDHLWHTRGLSPLEPFWMWEQNRSACLTLKQRGRVPLHVAVKLPAKPRALHLSSYATDSECSYSIMWSVTSHEKVNEYRIVPGHLNSFWPSEMDSTTCIIDTSSPHGQGALEIGRGCGLLSAHRRQIQPFLNYAAQKNPMHINGKENRTLFQEGETWK